MISAVQAVRAWRDAAGVVARTSLRARLLARGYEETHAHIARLTRLQLVDAEADVEGEATATIPVPGGVVEILAGGDVDLGAAQRERDAKHARLTAEIERAQSQLANDGFVAKAPAAVVAAVRDKLAALVAELEAL